MVLIEGIPAEMKAMGLGALSPYPTGATIPA